jgi:hypothetical protein
VYLLLEASQNGNSQAASTFVMWRAHLDVPKPDLILDSSMWYSL